MAQPADRRSRLLETPRLPSPGGFHAPAIEMAGCYSTIEPGNPGGGLWLPIVYNAHKDDPSDPDYVAMGEAPDARSIIDPFHILCAGVGDFFYVIRDPYRKAWMPLAPYGLSRNAQLGSDLAPGGESTGATITLFDFNQAGTGSISASVFSAISIGDPIPAASTVPVFYVPAERRWYTTTAYFEPPA